MTDFEEDAIAKREREERDAKLIREQEKADIKKIMQTKHGRRFISRQLAEFRIYQISFTGNSQTFFNEGVRQCGLWLLDEVSRICPDEYLQMLSENKQEESDDD